MANNIKVIRADEICNGDLVDLEDDEFADPMHNHPALEYEWQTVCYCEREAIDCIAIGFEDFDIIGFPPDHLLKVKR